MKTLVIDISKCNGCYNCQIACKDEHVGNDWSPYAKPQPETGHFWKKVIGNERGTFPKVKVTYTHDICQHCDDAPCIPACGSRAIHKRDDGIVIIDPEKCRGERSCIKACPYHAIYVNELLNIAQKCTFCAHLLDNGAKEPRCVDACPTGALTFGEEDELHDLIAKAEVIEPPENHTRPRVYYIALPKIFITGAVFDPIEDECIEGAKVTLTNREDGIQFTTATDEFGDFWIDGLKAGAYSLTIEHREYKPCIIAQICVEQDVNLGDIALKKAEE
jgi:tetrathionate reductase subunit B